MDNCLVDSPQESFLYKVLMSIKFLTCATSNGVSLECITEYMRKIYYLKGDYCSQIQASLEIGINKGFIHEQNENYLLVSPVAAIQNRKGQYKKREIERILTIFPPFCKKPTCQKKYKDKLRSTEKRKRSKSRKSNKRKKEPKKRSNHCDNNSSKDDNDNNEYHTDEENGKADNCQYESDCDSC